MPAREQRSLRSKLLRITTTIMVLMTAVTLTAVAWLNYVTEHERLADVEQHIRRGISSKGATLAQSQALALRNLVTDNAFSDVSSLVKQAVGQEDVVYGAFISAEGQAWAYDSPSTRTSEAKPGEDAWKELDLDLKALQVRDFSQRKVSRFGKDIQEFSAVVRGEEKELLGTVVYGLSNERLTQAVAAAREQSRQALMRALGAIGLLGLFSVALGSVLVNRASRHITEPIVKLTGAANEIAQGERGVRVQIKSGDEVEVLAAAFNQMLQANEDAMERLEITTQRALDADRMKGEFLANMSHEIRTPMNGVLGVVKLMQGQALDGKLWRYVDTIDASANALLTIINDILDFSKLEAGKYTIQSVPFQPKNVLQEVAELLASRAYDKGIELVYRADRSLPAYVIGDPDRLKQVLTNLMGNAIKFTDKGEVFVNMTVASRTDDQLVLEIAVRDTGIGIEAKDLPKLYEVFSQVDGSSDRKHGGTGLGLAISKRLLKMMGGDIRVESKPGVGSVFSFTVTVGLDERGNLQSSAPAPAGPKRVLVLEASRWQELIVEHLQAWGMDHVVVSDGFLVMAHLQQGLRENKKFDALVIGSDQAGGSVPELVKAVRADPFFRSLPIVLLATLRGASMGSAEREAVAKLQKPIRFSELYNCLVNSASGYMRQVAAAALPPVIQRLSQQRVLVVDDNDVNQFVAAEQLEGLGYRVDTAANGLEAVERVKRGGLSAVLMDCQMPVMDGYAATREIRKWETEQGVARRIPIIALTAHALAGERERVLNAGMDDYLSKPCRASALEKLLRIYVIEEDPATVAGSAASDDADLDLVLAQDIKRSEKLVKLFLSRAPEQLETLKQALASGRAPDVRAHAHKLKGSCLALGAGLMAQVAERMQKLAERDELGEVKSLIGELETQHRRVEALLRQELESAPREPGAQPS
jgi:signal transduction histidine kinase/DNA-binding response OmpR family regulator